MASFHFEGVDEFIKELEKLGRDVDDIAFKAVDEGAKIMDEELRAEIRKQTTKYGTGTLAKSIHHNKPRKNALGIFTASTARGKDDKKGKYAKRSHASYTKGGKYVGHRSSYGSGAVRNQDKMFYLEFGNCRQPARPFMKKSVNNAEPKVLKKMQEVFDREVGAVDNL